MPLRVKIRCYGGLLGDCFLLRFPRTDGAADVSMLIDFGVLQNFPAGESRLPAIAADIHRETGGKLDIVVVTHRHWDHVCGFGKAPGYADTVGELWMSWVENPDDPAGRRITGNVAKTEARLAAFAEQAGAALGLAASSFPELTEINNALTFTASASAAPGPGAKRLTTPGCIDLVRAKVTGAARYFHPSDRIAIPGSNVAAWVLGPPTDERLLADQDPSADKHEVFKLTDGMLGEALGGDDAPAALRPPFEVKKSLDFPPKPGQNPAAADWLAGHYGNEPWRRVDGIGMEALALQFDNIVNNTSLVLAFELEPGGDVLLFAADAQVGNWQSWRQIAWPDKADPEQRIAELLGRVVFYKVGHHGSINATASAEGLDRMTSPKLRAFIPVVESFARAKKPKGWDMPHESMRRVLETRACGRVARGDMALPDAFMTATDGFAPPVFTPDPADPSLPFHIDFEF